jgi:cation diffusion facilitator family transporter
LFETFLLLVTCIWIIYESIQRLFIHPVEVDASIWAFLVMAVSIVIDATRSKILYAAARKHNSQALEADALHFSTDIWSSSVVIGGLLIVKVAEWTGIKWLHQADAVAALGVAIIVIYVSVQLGARTIKGLLDTAPDGLAEKVESAAESVSGVRDCHAVRVRASGPDLFVDVHIVVDAGMDVAAAHTLTEQVEAAVRQVAGNADVTVHVEPQET